MDLKVRNIDSAVSSKLKEMAASKGMGVETLARHILSDFVLSPEIKYVEDKYSGLVRDIAGLYQSILMESNKCIEENNYLLEKIIKFLEVNDE